MGRILLSIIVVFLVVSLPVVVAERTNLILDRNGNLITGDGFYREYNGFNQLVTIREGNEANGSILREFLWDALDEKIQVKKVYENGELKEKIIYLTKEQLVILNSSGKFYETYVYQHDDVIAEIAPSGLIRAIHPDHLGSVHTITDGHGNVVEINTYSPFGEELSEVEARFAYEGKEHDSETGLTDFHFRKYSPEMGRFTQPDTLIPNVYDPQQLNRYAFERNNPMKHVDEDGHAPLPQLILLGAILILYLGPGQPFEELLEIGDVAFEAIQVVVNAPQESTNAEDANLAAVEKTQPSVERKGPDNKNTCEMDDVQCNADLGVASKPKSSGENSTPEVISLEEAEEILEETGSGGDPSDASGGGTGSNGGTLPSYCINFPEAPLCQ